MRMLSKRRLPRTKVLGSLVFKKWEEEERQSKETENKESDCRKPKGTKCHRNKGRVCQQTDLSNGNFCGNQNVVA